MDTNQKLLDELKRDWDDRPENTHRIRLHVEEYNLSDSIVSNKSAVFKNVVDKFKHREEARWCVQNQVELKFAYDHDVRHWFHVAVVYCDLTDQQYADYALRFMYL